MPNLLAIEQFRQGLELFNNREFYRCHEVLEDLWRPSRGPERLFLQALIHFAVGFYHHKQDNREGVKRQLSKALRKLAGYLPAFEGVNTTSLYQEGLEYLDRIIASETGPTKFEYPIAHPKIRVML